MNDRQYVELKERILDVLNLDLAYYKDAQMRRRLGNYVAGRAEGFEAFMQSLKPRSDELSALKDFLTINVSEFFRDEPQFKLLESEILPGLLAREGRLNVWSAGCSHGGEIYSVAMLLDEMAPGGKGRLLATDIDDDMLATCRAGGPYRPADVRAVPPRLRNKHFERTSDGYRIDQRTRSRVEFRPHDLLADRYERGFDLIMCRNVVIYFTDEAKDHIYRGFAASLRPGGVLFIGATEALLQPQTLGLSRVSTCFYRRPATSAAGFGAEVAA